MAWQETGSDLALQITIPRSIMKFMTKDDTDFLIEYFDGKFSTLLENIDTKIAVRLAPLKSNVADLKDDMKIVKLAVKDTNHDLHLLERRVEKLEAAA